MLKGKKLALIGAGFMGAAIARGLIKSGAVTAKQITAADLNRSLLKKLGSELKIKTVHDNSDAVSGADVILLAVKPQMIDEVAGSLKETIGKNKLVISIAAGVTTSGIENALQTGARVVRAMPNMAADVGLSATAIAAGAKAKSSDVKIALALFGAVGEAMEVEEKHMNAVTALSGSGPAFVFLFLEGLIDAGVRCGLARDTARKLSEQTLVGAGLMTRKTGEHPGALADRITSPGGTTIAGLAVMEEAGFKGIVIRAVEEAMIRAKELGE